MKIIILTGAELRHTFFRKALALSPDVCVVKSYCEQQQNTIFRYIDENVAGHDLQLRHLQGRMNSEADFFGPFVELTPDQSNPSNIEKGAINELQYFEEISAAAPDAILSFGCSIIKAPLLTLSEKCRFINLHLGLSPYYRGTGTNFWPLVNGEPEFVGATFMNIDAGVDTGEIMHQVRAEIRPGDSPHQIGNRLIAKATVHLAKLLKTDLQTPISHSPVMDATCRYYRNADFSPDAVRRLYDNFSTGLIDQYIGHRNQREQAAPILTNPGVVS